MRRLGGANVACLMLTDVSLGCEVPAAVMCSPHMTELVKAAADLADLDNDLFSYARESGPDEEFPYGGSRPMRRPDSAPNCPRRSAWRTRVCDYVQRI
jgi:hypothetical protein